VLQFHVASLRYFEAFKGKLIEIKKERNKKRKKEVFACVYRSSFILYSWFSPVNRAITRRQKWNSNSRRGFVGGRVSACIMTVLHYVPRQPPSSLWRGRYITADNGGFPLPEWFSPSCDSSAGIVYNHPSISIDLAFFTKSSSFN